MNLTGEQTAFLSININFNILDVHYVQHILVIFGITVGFFHVSDGNRALESIQVGPAHRVDRPASTQTDISVRNG